MTHQALPLEPPPPPAGLVVLAWLGSLACLAWAFAVLLGHSSARGAAPATAGILLAFGPALPGLLGSAWLALRAWRHRPLGLRFWTCLPPVGLCGYLVLGAIAALLSG